MSKNQTIISISMRKNAANHAAAVVKAKQLVVEGSAHSLSCVILDALAEYLARHYPEESSRET